MKRHAAAILVLLAAPAARAEDVGAWEGKTVAEWRTVLVGKDEKQKPRAAAALARIGPAAVDAIPELAKALGSTKNEDLRVNAALALGKVGGAGELGMHLPLRGLPGHPPGAPGGEGDPDPEAPDAPEGGDPAGAPAPTKDPAAEKGSAVVRDQAVPALLKALRDPCEDVRTNAARSVGLLGEDASAAIPALVKALGEKASNVRHNAAAAFETVPGPPETVVPVLGRLLADADATVANSAARALAVLGPKALPALKELEAALARDVEKPRSSFGGVPGLPGGVRIPGEGGFGQTPTLSCNLCLALCSCS